MERQRAELADAGARLDRERKWLQASQSECEGLATERGSAITEAQDFMRTVNDDLQELTLENMQLKEELAAANESRARMEVVNGMLKVSTCGRRAGRGRGLTKTKRTGAPSWRRSSRP